jgi:hypothetical protein
LCSPFAPRGEEGSIFLMSPILAAGLLRPEDQLDCDWAGSVMDPGFWNSPVARLKVRIRR